MTDYTSPLRLKEAAAKYFEQGIPVIPFQISKKPNGEWDKSPRVSSWKKWETEAQTEAEFESFQWDKSNAFGVILGSQAKNGLYLAIVDYDTKGTAVPDEAKEKGKQILKKFPITQTEETINKGIHLVYFSRIKPGTEGAFHDNTGLELLGDKKICVMAPSFGYLKVNDNTPTEIQDIGSTFFKLLAKHGFKLNHEETEAQNQQDGYSFSITKLIDISKLTKIGPDEYQGAHPIHDSTTEKNFTVNAQANTWYCFRHSSGGGALQFLAVKEGIIKCEDAKRGALRGQKFKRAIALAATQGLIKKQTEEEPESQADRLIKLCLESETILFYDQHKVAYARISEPLRYCDINGISGTSLAQKQFISKNKTNEERDKVPETAQKPQIPQERRRHMILPLRGKLFKAWLANLMWEHEEKAPGTEGLNSAINVLTGKALSEGKEYTLYNRVAPAEDGVWLDLSDECWRAIRVTSEGWEIVDDPPILFRRYNHQRPLIEPTKIPEDEQASCALKLLDFVNIPKDDNETKLSFICTCISYLIPLIPHPILVVYGPQGSAKTWLFRLIRRIMDPSSIEVLSLPTDDRELVQQLDHHWLALYDNLTSLPPWASDIFCRAATGMGFSKRELYSDDDDTIYNFKRCIGLNGINPAARRGDLLDRSMLVPIAKIRNGERKTEEALNAEFEKAKAEIIGGFLGVLAKSFKLYPEIKPNGFFRMADFTRYGCAIAEALGKTSEDFIKAYEQEVESQNEEAINANPVASTILDLCQKHFTKDEGGKLQGSDIWENTPTGLYQLATSHAQSLGIKTDARGPWPRAPNAFARVLNDITPSLFGVGYEITIKAGTPRKVIIAYGKQTKLIPEPEKPLKPVFFVKDVPASEKCSCGKWAVTKEIVTPQKDTLRRCEECFNKLKVSFAGAEWRPAYPELSSFEGVEPDV